MDKINQLIIKYNILINSGVLGDELIAELKTILSIFKLCEDLMNVKGAVDSHFHDLPPELKDLTPKQELIKYRGYIQQFLDK